MDYKQFASILNTTIFAKSKSDLVRKIATYPERYVGLFRPTRPKAKIIQNLLQSHEIRFGDAFEILIEKYLEESGYNILEKRLPYEQEYLELDQLFSYKKSVFFVEQKVRDDHDSSKKRGQIDNFEKKISVVLKKYKGKDIKGFFYFIDDSFKKNLNFYSEQIKRISSDYGISLELSYGGDLFDKLNINHIWIELLSYLEKWKNNIPELPEINFDHNPHESFDEIIKLKDIEHRKLLSNENIDPLLKVIFPERKTLHLLANHFLQQHKKGEGQIFKTLNGLCVEMIRRLSKNA